MRESTTVRSVQSLDGSATVFDVESQDWTIRVAFGAGGPVGKLADVELLIRDGGMLDGCRLIGFSVWQNSRGALRVAVPSRQYQVNGERRSFAIVRSMLDSHEGYDEMIARIARAYDRASEAHHGGA